MVVLLPWYLNKLYLEVIHSILHLLKVLLLPFVLAFIVALNLTSYYLENAIHDHIFNSYRIGKIQPYYQSFILCLVISHREIKMDHAFDLVTFLAMEYHTNSACLSSG